MTGALLALVLASAPDSFGIPPGREPLLLEMLDAPVRGAGCIGRGIEVLRDRVVAKIECADHLGALTLLPPGAPRASRRTERFSLVTDDPLPDALLDAVAEAVRAHEARWTWLEREPRARSREARGRFPFSATAAIVTAALLALLGLLRDSRGARAAPTASSGRPSWAELALFPTAWLLLALLVPSPPSHLDTARDMLTARDLAAGRSVLPAVPSSFEGLWHAALWIRALQLWLWSGLSLRSLHLAMLLGHAAAAAVVWASLARIASRGLALTASGLALLASLYVAESPLLWNPSLLPLPAALFSSALLRLGRGAGALVSLLAGAALGLCVQVHLVMALLAPALLFAIAIASRRPIAAALASAAGFSAAWTAGALDVAAAQARGIPIGAAAMAALACAGAGLALRGKFRALPEVARSGAVALAAAFSCAVALVALAALFDRALTPRYFAPLVPLLPIALALAWQGPLSSLDRWMGPGRWRAVAAVAAVLYAHTFRDVARRGREYGWTLLDAQKLAARLFADGWRPEELFRHLRTPNAPRRLLGTVLAFFPESASGSGTAHGCDLLAVKAPLEALRSPPQDWELLPLDAGEAAVLRCLPSAIAWQEPTLCYSSASPPSEETCAPASLRFASELLSSQAYPQLSGGPGEAWPEGRDPIRVRALVSAAGTIERPRVIETFATPPRWHVARADAPGPPGRKVALAAGARERLSFSLEVGPDSDFGRSPFPPDFVEREESERQLGELLAPWREKR